MRRSRLKTAQDENFPVGSRLIHPRLRPAVMRFYAFARAADDVADDPDIAPADKLRRLAAFEAALQGGNGPVEGVALHRCLETAGLDRSHARRLLVAFRRDASGLRCADWDALAEYCASSALPVGRFLLDLHGEPEVARPPCDALCEALQILNHLQDIRDDYRLLGRVYLPADWLRTEGVDFGALGAEHASPGLRRVIDRTLDRCDRLLTASADLPRLLRSRRLAGEAAATLHLARRLSRHLRTADPLARRVAPTRADFAAAALVGLAVAMRPPARTRHRGEATA